MSRHVRGRGYCCKLPNGNTVACERMRARIEALAIPPAWTNVWICTNPNGHLQATGRDDRDRKQYRYHTDWRIQRDLKKFEALADFGAALPRLRARVVRDLKRESADYDFVCAALVRLIDRTPLRVGTKAYAEENGTYGATTLRARHIDFKENGLRLDFKAKGGKRVRKQVSDRRLHQVLQRIDDLPGQTLFCCRTEAGDTRNIDSADINAYLGETLDGPHSAKTFRTWRGSVAAYAECSEATSLTIKAMCERAARALHNTPAICRSSYIHPDLIALADMSAEKRETRLKGPKSNRVSRLRVNEAGLLAFLQT